MCFSAHARAIKMEVHLKSSKDVHELNVSKHLALGYTNKNRNLQHYRNFKVFANTDAIKNDNSLCYIQMFFNLYCAIEANCHCQKILRRHSILTYFCLIHFSKIETSRNMSIRTRLLAPVKLIR